MVQLHNRARNWHGSDKLTCQFQAGRNGSPAPVPHGSTLPHDSDYSMTLRYAHLAPEFKLKAVEVLDMAPEVAMGGNKFLALVR